MNTKRPSKRAIIELLDDYGIDVQYMTESVAWTLSCQEFDVYDPSAEEPDTPHSFIYDTVGEFAKLWNS